MAKGFKHGAGGGAALNFKVVGGTTEPASPKENMIWVNTDAEITSWIFSATEPENPSEGMVWFPTGTSSPVEFNALKKNNISVYPMSAKQYVNGAWVNKTAKSYQNGAWEGWIRYLYYNGDEFTDSTGGWEAAAWRAWSFSGKGFAPTLTKGTQNMSVTMVMYESKNSNNGTSSGVVRTVNDIDLTDVSKVHVNLGEIVNAQTVTSQYGLKVGVYIVQRTAAYYSDNAVASNYLNILEAGTRTNVNLTVDVSSISGSYCIAIGIGQQQYKGDLTQKIRIDKVMLE